MEGYQVGGGYGKQKRFLREREETLCSGEILNVQLLVNVQQAPDELCLSLCAWHLFHLWCLVSPTFTQSGMVCMACLEADTTCFQS